jgi:hypothetical protein
VKKGADALITFINVLLNSLTISYLISNFRLCYKPGCTLDPLKQTAMKTNYLFQTFILALLLIFMSPFQTNAQTAHWWQDWKKYESNPTLEKPGTFFHSVLYEDDTYKMWFSVLGHGIGYAESSDGLSWNVYDTVVIPGGSMGRWDHRRWVTTVLRVDDTLRMWYMGATPKCAFRVGYAYSIDGFTWKLRSLPVLTEGDTGDWDENNTGVPRVYHDGSTYHMYYDNDWQSIGYANSTDGISWNKYFDNPVIKRKEGSWYEYMIESGGLVMHNDTLRMFFTGGFGTGSRLGYAWSIDYINWTVEGDNLGFAMDVGDEHDWDGAAIRHGSVIHHDNRYKMWYLGANPEQGFPVGIGYAEACITACLEDGYTFSDQMQIDTFTYNNLCCAHIGGDVIINGENIANLSGLDNVMTIDGDLVIYDNNVLEDLSGLEGLRIIKGDVKIMNNPQLTDLKGLEYLEEIHGDLLINGNAKLLNLSSLSALTLLDGELTIRANTSLSSLEGLDKLAPASIHGLEIKYNPALSYCHVNSICQYLIETGAAVSVKNNDDGCQNPEEVRQACPPPVGIEGVNQVHQFSIHPNPFANHLSVEYYLQKPTMVEVSILDLLGQKILTVTQSKPEGKQVAQIDTSPLRTGIYLCEIRMVLSNGEVRKVVNRIIKY